MRREPLGYDTPPGTVRFWKPAPEIPNEWPPTHILLSWNPKNSRKEFVCQMSNQFRLTNEHQRSTECKLPSPARRVMFVATAAPRPLLSSVRSGTKTTMFALSVFISSRLA